MQFQEFMDCIALEAAPRPDPSLSIQAASDGACLVDGFYALPLESTSSIYPRNSNFSVSDEAGTVIGDLLTCRGEEFSLARFSALYLAAYLNEVSKEQYGQRGRFARDYLLVYESQLHEYRRDFMDSTAVWGGFQHANVPIGKPSAQLSTTSIIARTGVKLASDIHLETAGRSVMQPYAFERFLKLYHLLELTFDQEIVKKIQALGDDLRGIGKILSNYADKELDRLKQILTSCTKPSEVIACIQEICADNRWHDNIRTIFFDYGKNGNPLSGKTHLFITMLKTDGYTIQGLKELGIIPGGKNRGTEQKLFEHFSLDLAAYWIYRVRCSIAHSRIGEYVMRSEDEAFVALFAEKLLRCVLVLVLV
jgi:hypothetical protein